jgi:hypothetical protein
MIPQNEKLSKTNIPDLRQNVETNHEQAREGIPLAGSRQMVSNLLSSEK